MEQWIAPVANYRSTEPRYVGADHVAQSLISRLSNAARGFRRFLFGRVLIRRRQGLVQLGIGERGTQRARQLVDDQTWRAGGRRQHVPETDFELLLAELVAGPAPR